MGQGQVQQVTHPKDTRLAQALTLLRDAPLNPESADHHRLRLRHPQTTECDPRICHHRSNQQPKDNSEDSK